MKSNIDIFISSTQLELECEREIAKEAIDNLKLQAILFELESALSDSPDKAFLQRVDECEIFVLILWKYFSPAVLKEYERAVLKNKPILIFVKDIHVPEERDDILNDFIRKYHDGQSHHKMRITKYETFRTLKQLRDKLTESIRGEIGKFFREPISTQSRKEMYTLGSEIIQHTQKRLYIFQRTPTLLFGLKDRKTNTYLSNYEKYENVFQENLEQWIFIHSKIEHTEFGYLFDVESSRQDLNKMRTEKDRNKLFSFFTKKIKHYKKIEESTHSSFKFSIANKPISGPLIIGDNKFGIWITGSEDAIAFSQENTKISNILVDMIESHFHKTISIEEIIDLVNMR